MNKNLYSIRMRAAQGGPHECGGKHISGAERIVKEKEIMDTIRQLIYRAQQHERGYPDYINLNIEMLNTENIREVTSLPIYTIKTTNYFEGREMAKKILELLGINRTIIEQSFHHLLQGPAPNGANMRGAILMDIKTGQRLEPDLSRGIRVSRIDYKPEAARELAHQLSRYGLNNNHVREALCLATKVSLFPAIVGELCWSDDPSYTAGYVASSKFGYLRFNHLKEKGSARGGRIFFVDPACSDLEKTIYRLEQEPYLITKLGKVNGEITYDDFKQIAHSALKGASK